jgi:pentatricopeptide repeat protein
MSVGCELTLLPPFFFVCLFLSIKLQLWPAKVGRIDEAYLILKEMMNKGLTPNVYTWNSLMDALVKAEEINEALFVSSQ